MSNMETSDHVDHVDHVDPVIFTQPQAPHTIYMFRGVPFRMFAGGQNRLLANPEPWE